MSCSYKNLFGIPGEGIHKYRIFGVAAVDLGLTLAVALILSRWQKVNFLLVFIGLMMLSVFVHKFFCVKTTLTERIFSF